MVRARSVQSNGVPVRISAVVVSTQHDENVTNEILRSRIQREVIDPFTEALVDGDTKFYINPTEFVIGGPMGDCGLTGRKIIVDTYGGGRHGGGAFSGKDASKVDRSAAYMARYVIRISLCDYGSGGVQRTIQSGLLNL